MSKNLGFETTNRAAELSEEGAETFSSESHKKPGCSFNLGKMSKAYASESDKRDGAMSNKFERMLVLYNE